MAANVTNAQIVDALRVMGYGDDTIGGVSLTGKQNTEFMQRLVFNIGIPGADFTKAKKIAADMAGETYDPNANQADQIIDAFRRRGLSDDQIAAVVQRARQIRGSPAAGQRIEPAYKLAPNRPGTDHRQDISLGVSDLLDAANEIAPTAAGSLRTLMGTAAPPTGPSAPASPASPAPTPAAGPTPIGAPDTRGQIVALQQGLNAKGAGLTVDGVMGPKTQAAVAKYGGAAPATPGTPAGPVVAPPAAGGPAAPAKLAANAPVADQIAFLKKNYGYSAWVLDDPELQPIFIRAATEGWDAARLRGALEPTKFWQTHSDTQRLKIEQKSSDPPSYAAGVATTRSAISAEMGRQGLTINPARLDQIATDAYNSGWGGNQIVAAVGAEFHYDPTSAKQPGEVGNLKKIAADYLVPLDDATVQQWGGDILSGRAGDAEFTEYVKGVAKGLFPTMAKSIDAGQTVAQLVAPYRSTIASTLEIAPGSVDFMDQKWMRLLTGVDPKTNQPTMKPLYDTMTELRTNPVYNYDKTTGAKEQGAQFSQMLAQQWGVM